MSLIIYVYVTLFMNANLINGDTLIFHGDGTVNNIDNNKQNIARTIQRLDEAQTASIQQSAATDIIVKANIDKGKKDENEGNKYGIKNAKIDAKKSKEKKTKLPTNDKPYKSRKEQKEYKTGKRLETG
eukprot:781781_1